MIDLDDWERKQVRANLYATDRALFRMGKQFGWVPPPPHPGYAHLVRIGETINKAVQTMGVALAPAARAMTVLAGRVQ